VEGSGLLWIGIIVAVLIFLDLLFVELRRIWREGMRIVARIEGYAELPIFAQLEASERDAERIASALEALEPLVARGQAALATAARYIPKGSSPG
jgi:hypothetical protein